MTKELKFELVVKEIIVGLVSGFVGVGVFSIFDPWDLFYSVMFGSMAGYVSMWIGIGVVGYLTLRKLGRQNEFVKSLSLSFLGLAVAIGLYALIISWIFTLIPYVLSSFVIPVVLPLTGAILGFNWAIGRPKSEFGLSSK